MIEEFHFHHWKLLLKFKVLLTPSNRRGNYWKFSFFRRAIIIVDDRWKNGYSRILKQYHCLWVKIEKWCGRRCSIVIVKIFCEKIIPHLIIDYLCYWLSIFINNEASLLSNMYILSTQLLCPNDLIFSYYAYLFLTPYYNCISCHTFNVKTPWVHLCGCQHLLFLPPVYIHLSIPLSNHD